MRTRFRHFLLTSAALLVMALPCTAAGQATGGLDREAGTRTAVLLFMTRDFASGLPLTAGEMREAFTGDLTAVLRAQGHDVVDPKEILPLIIEWRVRDGFSLGAGFLNGVAAQLGADRLLVADLVVKPRQLLLMTRSLGALTGTIETVTMDQVGLQGPWSVRQAPDRTAWLEALRDLCGTLVLPVRPSPSSGSGDFLVLPAHGIACDDDAALAATYSLLKIGQDLSGLALYDPGLVMTTLRERGVAPDRIGEAGRFLLWEVFHVRYAVASELISFDPETFQTSNKRVEDPGGGRPKTALTVFCLAARSIAVGTGAVVEIATVYRDETSLTGWFGVQHRASLIDQLQAAAADLWQQFHINPKDS